VQSQHGKGIGNGRMLLLMHQQQHEQQLASDEWVSKVGACTASP
jgi:hypothetical protein